MIDTFTMLVASGAVVAISGVTFILNTVLRRNDTYGRLWSAAFVAGILETIAYLVWSAAPALWWASAVGNGSLVLALALMWAGCRSFNRRPRTLVAVALVAGLVVTGFALAGGPDGGDWAGAWAMFVAIVVFAGLAGAEAMSGLLRHTVNGRVLAIIFFAVSLYYLLRLAVYLGTGESSVAFTVYFGTVTTTFIAIVLTIVASISMSVLQPPVEVNASRASRRLGEQFIPGVATLDQFEHQASDWLARSRRDREPLVLLAFAVDNFADITTAFGRELGDDALALVGRTACEQAPAAALVGFVSDERFLILTTPPSFGSPVDIAERLQTALVETPVDPVQGVRAVVTFGLATSDAFGHSLPDLERAARAAMREAQSAGPGTVRVAEGTHPLAES